MGVHLSKTSCGTFDLMSCVCDYVELETWCFDNVMGINNRLFHIMYFPYMMYIPIYGKTIYY